ncbi:MAG: hypothetical protein FWE25_09600 [Lachnospiraceae bacterium]|nr:hypothetical protein [Lachnospiraceae bacterium]
MFLYYAWAWFVPILRFIWTFGFLLGIGLSILAFVLKKDPVRQNYFWLVLFVGGLLVLGTGTCLLISL